jgi:DNA-binding CsgD family transcriptional regulator
LGFSGFVRLRGGLGPRISQPLSEETARRSVPVFDKSPSSPIPASPNLVRALRLFASEREGTTIRKDNRKLSPRQRRVIELVASGLKNREIAKQLGIAEQVVRNYLGTIFDKVGVSNRVELALWYEARTYEAKLKNKRQ